MYIYSNHFAHHSAKQLSDNNIFSFTHNCNVINSECKIMMQRLSDNGSYPMSACDKQSNATENHRQHLDEIVLLLESLICVRVRSVQSSESFGFVFVYFFFLFFFFKLHLMHVFIICSSTKCE